MPTFLKVLLSLIIVVICVLAGGGIGAWLPMRDIPPGEGAPGDGYVVFFFGVIGMMVGFFVGFISIMVFWMTLGNRIEAKPGVAIYPQEGIWPPPPTQSR